MPSVQGAAALATHAGTLRLGGLSTLSVEVAEAFEKHDDLLILNGVTTLSPEVAEAVARHKGPLRFDGLTPITLEVAAALAKHQDMVSLNRSHRRWPRHWPNPPVIWASSAFRHFLMKWPRRLRTTRAFSSWMA